MKKSILAAAMIAVSLALTGCGQKPESNEQGVSITDQVKDTMDVAKGIKEVSEIGEGLDSDDPEKVQQAMENLANLGADMAVREFERTSAVDAPENFAPELLYANGKVVSTSDNSDESYYNQDVTIKTLDEFAAVRDHYKQVLAKDGWKISSQNNPSADRSSFTADKNELTANVSISRDQYSKITEVDIHYGGESAPANEASE